MLVRSLLIPSLVFLWLWATRTSGTGGVGQ